MSDTPLRLVLFDFDGTLCDSAATIIRLMKQACAACDLPVPEDSFIRGNIGHGVSHAALSYADGNPEKASQLADTYRMIARDEYLGGQPPLDPLEYNIPTFTTIPGAKAAIKAIKALQCNKVDAYSLQEIHNY